MDSVLFEKWVRETDAEFKVKERNVVLIIDNCPAHHETENFSHVKLIFLPPNATSVTQPMVQDVFKSLKGHYRNWLVRVILAHLLQDKPIPEIPLLKAMHLFVSSLNDASKETVIN